jgi:hypothetical protein
MGPIQEASAPLDGALRRFSVDHRRTSAARIPMIAARAAHAGSGDDRGRSHSLGRKISAKSARGTAISASWTTTLRPGPDDPDADLHELLAQLHQRELGNRIGQCQRAQEDREVTDQGVELQARWVVAEGAAGQPQALSSAAPACFP